MKELIKLIMGQMWYISVIGIIVGVGLTAVLFVLPTLLLWNWLMPTIFELPYINFWQALGIILLSGILFRYSYPKKSDK